MEKPNIKASAVSTYLELDLKRTGLRIPLEDPDFVAALLYEVYRDGSKRRLELYGEPVCIIEFWEKDAGRDVCARTHRIPVSSETAATLQERVWLEGARQGSHTDTRRLTLTERGKRAVVEFLFEHNRSSASA